MKGSALQGQLTFRDFFQGCGVAGQGAGSEARGRDGGREGWGEGERENARDREREIETATERERRWLYALTVMLAGFTFDGPGKRYRPWICFLAIRSEK